MSYSSIASLRQHNLIRFVVLFIGSLISFLACSCSLIPQTVNAPKSSYYFPEPLCSLTDYSDITLQPLQIQSTCEVDPLVQIEISMIIQQTFIRCNKFRTVDGFKTAGMRFVCPGKMLVVDPTVLDFQMQGCDGFVSVLFQFKDNETQEILGSVIVHASGGAAGLHAAISTVGVGLEEFIFWMWSND